MAKNNLVITNNRNNLWVVVGVALVVGLVAGIFGSSVGNLITGNAVTNVGAYRVDIPGSAHTSHFNYGTNQDTYIRPGTNAGNVIMDYGNVGIGTANPYAKLDVNGTLRVRQDLSVDDVTRTTGLVVFYNPTSPTSSLISYAPVNINNSVTITGLKSVVKIDPLKGTGYAKACINSEGQLCRNGIPGCAC